MNFRSQSVWVTAFFLVMSVFLVGCPATSEPSILLRQPQSVDLYGEGTTMSTVTVNSGDTFNMDAVYALIGDYNATDHGPLADEVRFTFAGSIFDPIPNQTITTQGMGQTWTVPVTVKGTAPSGSYTVTGRLYDGGTLLSSHTDGISLFVVVNNVTPASFAVITMTPADVGINGMASAELIYSNPSTENRTWFSTSEGLIPDPGADQTVNVGGTGFMFDVQAGGNSRFAAVTWAANFNSLMARYEMFLHPDGPAFMAGGTWSGNLNGDQTGTATLSLEPMRTPLAEQSGLHWTSNVSVDVVIDTSNQAMMSWTEETDYPFAEANGNLNYRISIDGVVGGQLQVTVEERDGINVVETFTGLLTSN